MKKFITILKDLWMGLLIAGVIILALLIPSFLLMISWNLGLATLFTSLPKMNLIQAIFIGGFFHILTYKSTITKTEIKDIFKK